MTKRQDHSWWTRGPFQSLTAAKWDIIIIMLGTDDAVGLAHTSMDTCKGPTTLKCPFAQDFASMIEQVNMGQDPRHHHGRAEDLHCGSSTNGDGTP
jgi:hypothetical protein